MLQKLRDQTQGTGFKVLVIAIIAVLTLFGFGATNLFVGADPEVAKVGDISITQSRLALETERARIRILGQQGPDFDPSAIDRLALQQSVVQDLVNRQIAYQTAVDLGVRTPPEEINASLVENEAYQIDGQFNEAVYRQYLSQLGYNPVEFLEEYTSAVSTEVIRGGVENTVAIKDWELAEMVRVLTQTRDLAYLPLTVEQFADDIEVSDEDVEVRYDEQQTRYLTPLTLDVAYLDLSVDSLLNDPTIEIVEEDLVSLYEEERQAALRDEQRDSSHILVQINDDRPEDAALTLATELATRLQEGETFEALAREFSEDPGSAENGGSLGPVGKGIFDPAFEEALWALGAAGDVSAPVKSSFGYHLIRLDEIVEKDYPAFEDEREALELRARRLAAQALFADKALDLERAAYDEQYALDATAESLGLTLEQVTGVTEADAAALGGIFASRSVVNAAFSDEVLGGVNSEALTIGEEQLVVLRVNEQYPPEIRPLDDVRDEIRAELVRERALVAVEEAKDRAFARLSADESVAEIARDVGVEWQTIEAASRSPRTAQEAAVPAEVRRYAFSLPRPPEGEKAVGVVDLANGAALVTVTRVEQGDVNTISQGEVEQLRQIAQQRAARLSFQSLLQAAEDRLGVDRPAPPAT